MKVALTAINHWEVAVATHTANHPDVRHLCASLDSLNPRSLFRPGQLDLLWASPECTHHSIARGGKPINDQSRATAWCVVRWAEALLPKVILVENVREFMTWGPIGSNGRPLKRRKGETFRAWVSCLESLGYHVDRRILRAADFGDPTTRERLFIQAVRGHAKIVWPVPTHAARDTVDLFTERKTWVSARDIIDWDLPGESIFERERPLSPKTMRRIWKGLERYGLKPYLVQPGHGDAPGRQEARVNSIDEPVRTIPTSNRFGVVQPYIVQVAHGNDPGTERDRSHDIAKPLPTVSTKNGFGVCEPFIVRYQGMSNAESIDAPLSAVTTRQKHSLLEPYLVKLRGTCVGQDVDNPVPTLTTAKHVALCEPLILPQMSGGKMRPVSDPLPTITTTSRGIALTQPFLVKYFGTGGAASVDQPLDTVTTRGRFGLVKPEIVIDGEKYLLDIRFRMLQPHELAAAQGFPKGYHFEGTKTDKVRQIGNAVPVNLARALCSAVIGQLRASNKRSRLRLAS